MGRYTSLVRITGSFNDATLCKDGTARNRTTLTKEKWDNHPKFANSREAAALFGGASMCAAALIKRLPDEMRQQARPHASNHIANGIRALQRERTTKPERFTFEEALLALHRLDLSKDRSLAHLVQVKTIGHPLQPKGIHITGLKEAAEAITERCQLAQAGQQLQMRLHFGFSAFQDLKINDHDNSWIKVNSSYSNHQPSTAWLPAECIPAQGLPMALVNPNDKENQVLCMAVEWRQVPAGERSKTWHQPTATEIKTPTQGKIARRGKALNDKIATAQDPNHQPINTRNPLKSTSSVPNPKDLGLFKIAALCRAQAQMHLPVPAYMQDTATRHFRIHPAKRKLSRPPMSAALRFRTSLPLPQKQQQEIPQRSFITFAPDLLPKRTNRQPVPEQQKPAATTQVAATPTPQAQPAKAQPTTKTQARQITPTSEAQAKPTIPSAKAQAKPIAPPASPRLARPYSDPSPGPLRVWTNLGGIPYVSRIYPVPACFQGHFNLLLRPFQNAPTPNHNSGNSADSVNPDSDSNHPVRQTHPRAVYKSVLDRNRSYRRPVPGQ